MEEQPTMEALVQALRELYAKESRRDSAPLSVPEQGAALIDLIKVRMGIVDR